MRPRLVALVAVLAFGVLAATATHDPVRHADRELFSRLYSGDWLRPGIGGADGGALDSMLPLFNRAADLRTLAAGCMLIAIVLLLRRDVRALIFLALAVIPVALASLALERVFDRAAPYPSDGPGSFPSGHAMLSMAIVVAAVCLMRRARDKSLVALAGAAFAAGVGVAVIADGGHWPSDVVAGWLLAIAWVAALCSLFRPRRSTYAQL